jgi:hypothetical protein
VRKHILAERELDHLLLAPIIAKRLKDAGVDRHVRGWEKSDDNASTWSSSNDTAKTPDGRYILIRSRLWRASVSLSKAKRRSFVAGLIAIDVSARWAVSIFDEVVETVRERVVYFKLCHYRPGQSRVAATLLSWV